MVYREIRLMGHLNAQYVVTYYGACIIPGAPLAIVMEYVEGGSLTKLLKDPDMDDKFRCKLALDVAKGMAFLHSNNIFHRDLKPDNLLVVAKHRNVQINLKITDFGTSRAAAKKTTGASDYMAFTQVQTKSASSLPPKEAPKAAPEKKPDEARPEFKLTKGVGTLIYQAPEILEGKSDYAIDKTDIFSFGVLLWQVFTGLEPFSQPEFKDFDKFQIVQFVQSGKRFEIPESVPPKIRELIKKCWSHRPQDRPSFADIAVTLEKIYASMKDPVNVAPPSAPSAGGGGGKSSDTSPVPRITPEQLIEIGWSGGIGRVESEEKLKDSPLGTFLVRWSHNTSSYVLSFVIPDGKFQHIAYIRPSPDNNDAIIVDKQDGSVARYGSIMEYISAMKQSGIIKVGFVERNENHYEKLN